MLFSRRWWWTTLLVILGIAVAVRLGIWQLDRHAARQAAIEHIQQMEAMPALDLNQRPLPADLASMEYRQVIASGSYDFDHQVALRNQVRNRMSGTDPGLALVTPLILPDGQAVLVQRGWIPIIYNSADTWRQFDEPGQVTLSGIIRLSLDKGEMGSSLIDPTVIPGGTPLDHWNYLNLPRLQEQLPYPILSIYVQQAAGSDPESQSLPYRQVEAPDLDPGSHMGFALQWFFYAGLLLIGYPIWLKKQKPSQVVGRATGN